MRTTVAFLVLTVSLSLAAEGWRLLVLLLDPHRDIDTLRSFAVAVSLTFIVTGGLLAAIAWVIVAKRFRSAAWATVGSFAVVASLMPYLVTHLSSRGFDDLPAYAAWADFVRRNGPLDWTGVAEPMPAAIGIVIQAALAAVVVAATAQTSRLLRQR